MADTFVHPLERQNALERKIQLEGAKDPENFKMPDGRTLADVRRDLQDRHKKEFNEETLMMGQTTRESSSAGLTKGKDLVMTETGNIIDVTSPPAPEPKENKTLAEMKASAYMEAPEDFDEPKAEGSGGANPVPTTSATPPSASSLPSGNPTGTTSPGSTGSTSTGNSSTGSGKSGNM